MSYKVLQLFPLSTRGTRMRISIRGPWSAPLTHSQDTEFLRTWLTYDSELDEECAPQQLNWNVILGMVLVFGVSASFWTGVGMAVAEVWG
jgi:hypothetical protein